MPNRPMGKQSFTFEKPPVITAWASVVGKKEAEGPLGKLYDITLTDAYAGEKTWEQGERKLQQLALQELLKKTCRSYDQINAVFSGDLLNQCISSSISLNNMSVPHLGLYGACSTMAESMLLASMSVGGCFMDNAVAMTSSHFPSSERQFRFPLGYGGQRTPTAQWTATGSGAVLIGNHGIGPKITACTVGTVVDKGIKDANNMGAAMAPAAYATIKAHFHDLNVSADSFDRIITGDLGHTGKELLSSLFKDDGLDFSDKLMDCGEIVFERKTQDVHSGGSGCGCSAIVLCSYLLNELSTGKLKRILFCGTGALLSPTSVQQGLSIPGVCHAISIEGV